jgi:serine/threonine-protein kinase
MDLRDQLQTTLGDAYRLERELVGGGMSRVFLAEEKALGRRVVVKVLPLETAGQLSLERFRREVAIAAQLQHPHIVPLLTAGETGGLAFYTMPFIQGESLRARLSKVGELPVSEASRVLREVASALAFAHQAGIVHRDIKPDNVLLAGGAAMVSDFGVAKALIASSSGGNQQLTTLGIALGTPSYMAPEQASADPNVDHRADIYAWGVLAYELLTGSTPFTGRSPQAVLAAQVSEQVEPLGRRRPHLPPTLENLVMRCLEKRPADRPQSAEELVRALDEMATPSGGMRATSGRFTPAGTRWTPARRSTVVGLVVLAAAAVPAALYLRDRSKRLASSDAAVASAAAAIDPKTIAVLPFENIPPDSTTEYFAQGLRDEIAEALTKVPAFRVVERASSVASKERRVGAAAIGRLLHAGSLVQGSVRRAGGQLRVQVELIDAGPGLALWAQGYGNQARNDVAVQIGIAQAIAESLRVHLGGGARTIVGVGTHDPEAHDLYLRGAFYLGKYTEPNIRKAMTLFRQASVKDARYAAPWAGTARAWMYLADDWLAPRDAYPRAKEAALKALALDSSSAGARVELGKIYEYYEWEFAAAEREFRRALRDEPRNADAHFGLANILRRRGARDSALVEYRKSFEMDPIDVAAAIGLAYGFLRLNQVDSAAAQLKLAGELDPAYSGLATAVARLRMQQGRWADAQQELEHLTAFGRLAQSLRIVCEARLGRLDAARAHLAELEAERKQKQQYVGADYIAQGYAALGDRDAAFRWLEQAYADRSGYLFDPELVMPWDPIHSDPRFVALERRVNSQHGVR